MSFSALFLVTAIVLFILTAIGGSIAASWMLPAGLAAFAAAFLVGGYWPGTPGGGIGGPKQ